MKILITLCFIFIASFSFASPNPTPMAPILFEDNFDNTTDWRSKQYTDLATDIAWTSTNWMTCTTFCPPDKGVAPIGWAGYRVSKSHWATDISYPNPYVPPNGVAPATQRDTLIIDSESPYGGVGKSLKYNVETASTSPLGSGWSAGSMYVWLGDSGYNDIYIRVKLKYPSDWKWTTVTNDYHAYQKLIRLVSFNGDITNLSQDPSNTQTGSCYERLWWIPDFYYNKSFPASGTWLKNSTVNSAEYESTGTLKCSDYITTDYTTQFVWPTDGEWHTYEFHAKLNSAPGVADGIWEISIDGQKTAPRYAGKTDMIWVHTGDSMAPAWNWLMLFDNLNMQVYPLASNPEQQIIIDDIVVYQPITESHILWETSPQDGRLPLTYSIGEAPADITPPISVASKASGRYLTSQSISLSSEDGAVIKYCLLPNCTPDITYSTSIPVLKNIASQTLRYFATDTNDNEEEVKELVFRKQKVIPY